LGKHTVIYRIVESIRLVLRILSIKKVRFKVNFEQINLEISLFPKIRISLLLILNIRNPQNTEGVQNTLKKIQTTYPNISFELIGQKYKVIIPEKYREGHETHFARVTEHFLDYLKNGNMPAWEVPNMLAKYYTTTQGLDMARK
jgi:Putative oxidoreductase C terminal domain